MRLKIKTETVTSLSIAGIGVVFYVFGRYFDHIFPDKSAWDYAHLDWLYYHLPLIFPSLVILSGFLISRIFKVSIRTIFGSFFGGFFWACLLRKYIRAYGVDTVFAVTHDAFIDALDSVAWAMIFTTGALIDRGTSIIKKIIQKQAKQK